MDLFLHYMRRHNRYQTHSVQIKHKFGPLLKRVMDKWKRKGKLKDQQNLFMVTMATMTTTTTTIIPTMDIAMVGEHIM